MKRTLCTRPQSRPLRKELQKFADLHPEHPKVLFSKSGCLASTPTSSNAVIKPHANTKVTMPNTAPPVASQLRRQNLSELQTRDTQCGSGGVTQWYSACLSIPEALGPIHSAATKQNNKKQAAIHNAGAHCLLSHSLRPQKPHQPGLRQRHTPCR